MLKKIPLLLITAITLAACSKSTKCGEKLCTEEFATITIRVLNADNSPALLKIGGYTVVNQRTKARVYMPAAMDYYLEPGVRFVVADNSVKELSETGDDLKITAIDSTSNQTKTAIVKVKGGECACHIAKVSGPDTLKFD